MPEFENMDMGEGESHLFEPILWRIRRAFLPPVPPVDTLEEVLHRMKRIEMLRETGPPGRGMVQDGDHANSRAAQG